MKKLLYAVAAIVVSLSAVSCSEETKSTSVEPMNIEFWEMCDYSVAIELTNFFYSGSADALVREGLAESGATTFTSLSSLIIPEYPSIVYNGNVVSTPVGYNCILAADASNINLISEYLELASVKAELDRITGGSVKLAWSYKNSLGEAGDGIYILYALQGSGGMYPAMDGSGIVEAKAAKGQFGGYEVSIVFNDEAAKEFEFVTIRNIGRHLAIVGNGKVFSLPVVNGRIDGGHVTISGDFDKQEAEALAKAINAK